MKSTGKMLAMAILFTASASAMADNSNPILTPADQCMIDAYQEIFRQNAATKPVVDIHIAPIKEECEQRTNTQASHPELLEKGLSNFSAGGTKFNFK